MCDKVKYTSIKRAKQSAYAIKAKGYIAARESLQPYACKHCGCWHLSKIGGQKYSWH